jgi:hypothetical protein
LSHAKSLGTSIFIISIQNFTYPASNNPEGATIKRKAKCRTAAATMPLFCVFQENCSIKVGYFSKIPLLRNISEIDI